MSLSTVVTGQVFRLWPGDAPGAKGTTPADIPTLSYFRPLAPASGAAVVVCPGGGYVGLAPHEADPIAQWLCSLGIAGLVLRYRVNPYQHPAPLTDAQRAIRMVRHHAQEWNIDPNRIGILGFSAGGHLSASASTLYDAGDPSAVDPIDRVSSRPDAAILVYPVISMSGVVSHVGCRNNLLGQDASEAVRVKLSPECNVTPQTPPAFMFHSVDDPVVPIEHSLAYAAALRKAGVAWELHAYEKAGGHGVGLASDKAHISTWPGLCAGWLKQHGWA